MSYHHIYVLVDFFNIRVDYRNRGLGYVLDKIVEELTIGCRLDMRRLTFRLYGGWHESGNLTQVAQDLLQEIDALPTTYDVPGNDDVLSRIVVVRAELAQSLLAAPSVKLLHTLRSSRAPRGIRVGDSLRKCVEKGDCPLEGALKLFKKSKCPKTNCHKPINDLFYRSEQKMVDSLICADAAFLLRDDQDLLVIVSSDEDMAPIIKLGLCWPAEVIHFDCARRISESRIVHSEKSYRNMRI